MKIQQEDTALGSGLTLFTAKFNQISWKLIQVRILNASIQNRLSLNETVHTNNHFPHISALEYRTIKFALSTAPQEF